jgi:hypothetical protein
VGLASGLNKAISNDSPMTLACFGVPSIEETASVWRGEVDRGLSWLSDEDKGRPVRGMRPLGIVRVIHDGEHGLA